MFLVLNGMHPELPIVPTYDLDQVWHAHVLDTAKYRRDCDFLYDAFLDHFPYFGLRSEEDRQDLERGFAATRELYLEVFGTDPYASSVASDCSECSCNSCSSCTNGCGCTTGCVSDAGRTFVNNERPTITFEV